MNFLVFTILPIVVLALPIVLFLISRGRREAARSKAAWVPAPRPDDEPFDAGRAMAGQYPPGSKWWLFAKGLNVEPNTQDD